MSKYGVVSGPYFPTFGLNTDQKISLSLRIQSDYERIWTRNNSVFGRFSRSVFVENTVSDVLNNFSATLSKRDSFIRCFFNRNVIKHFFTEYLRATTSNLTVHLSNEYSQKDISVKKWRLQ